MGLGWVLGLWSMKHATAIIVDRLIRVEEGKHWIMIQADDCVSTTEARSRSGGTY